MVTENDYENPLEGKELLLNDYLPFLQLSADIGKFFETHFSLPLSPLTKWSFQLNTPYPIAFISVLPYLSRSRFCISKIINMVDNYISIVVIAIIVYYWFLPLTVVMIKNNNSYSNNNYNKNIFACLFIVHNKFITSWASMFNEAD